MEAVDGQVAKKVAVLHDIVEDIDWTLADLKEGGVEEQVVNGVRHMTQDEEEDYDEFIRRAGSHSIARKVKVADLRDNLDLYRLDSLTEEDLDRVEK